MSTTEPSLGEPGELDDREQRAVDALRAIEDRYADGGAGGGDR